MRSLSMRRRSTSHRDSGIGAGSQYPEICRVRARFVIDELTGKQDRCPNHFQRTWPGVLLAAGRFESAKDAVKGGVDDVWLFQGDAEQADDVTVLAVVYSGTSRTVNLHQLELRVPNRLVEIDRVNTAFNEFAERHAVPAKLRCKITLVFDELLNNIITYAYEDEDQHFIEVDIRLSPSGLAVTITDDGKPFNPFDNQAPDTSLSVEDRPIGGLGVHLVRNVMDRVAYERHGENNVVLLEKEFESSQKI